MNKSPMEEDEQFDFWEGLNQYNESEILERMRLQGEHLKARGSIDPGPGGNSFEIGEPRPWSLRRKIIVCGWALLLCALIFGFDRWTDYSQDQADTKLRQSIKNSEQLPDDQDPVLEGLVQ